jgi:hypothetical protein
MPRVKTRTKGAKTEGPEQPTAKVTKTRAIAVAVRALGWKAGSEDLVGYARQKFGLKVTPGYALSIKSALKQKRKKPSKVTRELPTRKRARDNGPERMGKGLADPFALIVGVKELARKAGGMETLKRLVEVLAD